jgi:pilus assembly protein Flp/PilA
LTVRAGASYGQAALGAPGSLTERRCSRLMTSIHPAIIELFDLDEEGQGLAEYALILSLIAIVAIFALAFLGTNVSSLLSTVGNSV